jgi:hypothetical protein
MLDRPSLRVPRAAEMPVYMGDATIVEEAFACR